MLSQLRLNGWLRRRFEIRQYKSLPLLSKFCKLRYGLWLVRNVIDIRKPVLERTKRQLACWVVSLGSKDLFPLDSPDATILNDILSPASHPYGVPGSTEKQLASLEPLPGHAYTLSFPHGRGVRLGQNDTTFQYGRMIGV